MLELERYPDYIFEVSWEVCNKVGGIHTVISTKVLTLERQREDQLLMIGPDIYKGSEEHREFMEDKKMFSSWKQHAASIGLHVKVGRWKIAGNPIVLLVDFSPFYKSKDDILKKLWLGHQVDSLSGGWDYIEPTLFAYAAGKVIECFYHYYFTFSDKIIAHFHEWLTGAGLLYLKERVPQIATVFTTHATTLGRSIAGSGRPFYSKMQEYIPAATARDFNVIAKHSMETRTAASADCFTVVSSITERECIHFLATAPDVITPNGFDEAIVPSASLYKEKRILARQKLLSVAQALLGQKFADDTLLLIQSGRYEFRNKGIDLFIDALEKLNQEEQGKELIAFIFVPAHNTGPRKDLLEKMFDPLASELKGANCLTHYLQGVDSDLIFNRINKNLLDNTTSKRAKVIFVPEYMDGYDGVFNMHYYDLLIGFDLSVFPSYYEPWGYTPQESLAFHVPTITTGLSGFGSFMKGKSEGIADGIAVLDRNDDNDLEFTQAIVNAINEFIAVPRSKSIAEAAYELSKTTSWKQVVGNYKRAFSIALNKAAGRAAQFVHAPKVHEIDLYAEITTEEENRPVWRKMFVQPVLPAQLKALGTLARNMWWSWNNEARELFESINAALWQEVEHNPMALLNALDFVKMESLEKDVGFIARLNKVLANFEAYMKINEAKNQPKVAYFCMEYGICSTLHLYAGGLGILAGDYVKEASDSGADIVAVGLLYRGGYFKQEITNNGEQHAVQERQKFTNLPLLPVYDSDKQWLKIALPLPGRIIFAKVWKVEVGRVPLYLLDTDIQQNSTEDRALTQNLYGGDEEYRLKQEMLLGIGGVLMLNALHIKADVFHCNEGHAAFTGLQRIVLLVQEHNLSFDEALEVVRSSSLFTTHTPIAAGHDRFQENMLRVYLSYLCNLLNISWERFLSLGKTNVGDNEEFFSMSYLAARLSQEINGVSNLHEKVSRKIFSALWKGYAEEELSIGHVTNGVHYPTWTADEWQHLYADNFEKTFTQQVSTSALWKNIYKIENSAVWNVHLQLKRKLIQRIKLQMAKGADLHFDGEHILNEQTLIVAFARRFATYKRATLLFHDLDRLATLLSNSSKPIVFVFAGKAHPKDLEGQELLKRVVEVSQQDRFKNHIVFLEGYDIALAKIMTEGADVWLNLPIAGNEASGTSGMKAVLNGVVNCSVADGWWAEAYKSNSGWNLPANYNAPNLRDQQDSELLYQIFEQQIVPLFFERNKNDVPDKWVEKMKNSIADIAPYFTTHRMLKEYRYKYYLPLFERHRKNSANNFAVAKALIQWKNKVALEWSSLNVVSPDFIGTTKLPFPLGKEFQPSLILDIGNLSPDDIGVEMVFINKRLGEVDFDKIILKKQLSAGPLVKNKITFSTILPIDQSGVYEYGFRIFPKNDALAHQHDLLLLKWV
jgi:phosphorylase/glycogen(starch) synthase